MTKSVRCLGVTGLVVGLLMAGALSVAAQGLLNARQNVTTDTVLDFKGICFRSLLGINDEVLADTNRFSYAKDWIPAIELGERFVDFTNATVMVRKDRNTGKLALSDVKFVKALGPKADEKVLLKEYEHAVDLVCKLLGVNVTCPGLVDPATYLRRRFLLPMDRRIKSRICLNLAKGQRVEIEATEASYIIRAGQPMQTGAPTVEIKFAYNGSFGVRRSGGQDSESVKELTLGTDCSDLLSARMKALPEQQRQQIQLIKEELKRVREAKAAATKSECAASCSNSKSSTEKISVAEKLGQCDFLLNKDFKKSAKVYLCLFSASWCPPCRREMPRIAKTYAETLKGDPDIELIHFSRDQNDEKAMAWAKEHNVKFPVVKPKGGNPLDLHCNGIPHLFIVKADGTLLEEGHPMRIFNEEKFREIKGRNLACVMEQQADRGGDSANGFTEEIDGYMWSYRVNNGEAEIVAEKSGKYYCAVSPKPTGSLVIPSVLGGTKVTSIGQNAFYCCSELTSVAIPSSVGNIGHDAFFDCRGLTSLTLPDGVTSIGGSAFAQCSGLTSVTIPSSVTSLGGYSFYYCSRLKSVTIPSSVTSIGSGSFNNCRGLLEFIVEEGNPAYCSVDGVLYNKNRTSLIQYPCAKTDDNLTIPSSVSSIGHGVLLGCRGLRVIDVDEGNPAFCSVNGILYNKNRTKLIQCPGGKCGEVTIPEGVTSIGSSGYWAFRECRGLTSVIIPSTVASIVGMAFLDCGGLTSVMICGGRPNVGDGVFSGCGKLKSIHVPSNSKSWAGLKEWQGKTLVFDGLKLSDARMSKENDQQTKIDAAKAAVDNIKGAVTTWMLDNKKSTPPSTLSVLVKAGGDKKPKLDGGEEALVDPWGQSYMIQIKGKWFAIVSAGPDTKFHTADDIRTDNGGDKRQDAGRLVRTSETKAPAAKNQGLAASTNCVTKRSALGEISVAEKLQSCDFLLNKDFKKNAKVYLCLFSASWCPPCRAEMPRIAKTYAETLKDDPDIELVHFSRDQNDEKAMAWAKEHNVKFPVVKPNGGNPLDLHSRGIPHLFIVKADGTLLEEGHPMRIFNEEKFREIKSGNVKPRAAERTEQSQLTCETTTNGVKWSYKIVDGGVVFKGGYCSGAKLAVPQETSGALVIPDKLGGYPVRCIDEAAFRYCRRLTSVTIPSTVTSIRGNPFSGCSGIESFVVAPDNPMYSSVNGLLCTKDGKTVIAGVKGDLKIPEGVTTIGKSAFYACWGLKSVSIPSSVKKIEPLAFYNSGLTSVTIPEGVVSIGNSAFGDCWGMTSVTLPSSVVDIGSQAFSAMSGKMKSIQVSPDNQKFASVNSLLCSKDGKTVICGVDGDVVIPDGVRSIGDSAFYKCQGLLTVTIPPSVTKIGNAAFEWCDKIRSFAVASANPEYESSNGLLCSKDGGILIAGVNGSVEIPEGVTEIVDSAFSGRNELTAVTIPLSVTKIGKEAFRCCRGLTMVKMLGERPNSDREVFCYCKMLKAIHVPPNAKSWAGMKEWQGIPLVFDAEAK